MLPELVDVAAAGDVPATPPFLHVRVRGRELLLLRDGDGRVRALDRACPHLGNPLTLGCVTGTTIECTHHYYAYDLETGRNTFPGDETDIALPVHRVVERAGRILVAVSTAGP